MRRARKRHIQQEMFDSRGKPKARGGKRRGAGRKPKGKRAGARHKARPDLTGRDPAHVVLRVASDIGSLRKRHMYTALRAATIAVAMRELHDKRDGAFRIVHISIQGNHIHVLVEADHKLALARGMQSFQISAAKHLNRAVSVKSVRVAIGRGRAAGAPARQANAAYRQAMANRRRGGVFTDRYHAEIITTPKQARHALAYVLNNWRKHKEDRHEFAREWRVDPYSTAVYFDGWKERKDAIFAWPLRETYDPLIVYLPKTWLLREGWRRHGLIGLDEVPSAKKSPASVPRG